MASANAVDDRPAEYRISRVPGLTLLVQPTGTATFYLVYASKEGAREVRRRLKLGRRGQMSLDQAKRAAVDALGKVGNGTDLVREKRERRSASSFEVTAREMLAAGHFAVETTTGYKTVLENDVYSLTGPLPLGEVTRDHCEQVIGALVKRGSLAMADRAKFAIASVFKFAGNERGFRGPNPARGISNRASTARRKRPLSDVDLARVLIELDQPTSNSPRGQAMHLTSPSVHRAILLCLLTGCRRTEVAAAQIAELDLPNGRWTIPGAVQVKGRMVRGRTKNQREKIVPLSKQAAALFTEAIKSAGSSPFVFPGEGVDV